MGFEEFLFSGTCFLWLVVGAMFLMLQAQQQRQPVRQVIRLSSVREEQLLDRVAPYVRNGYHVIVSNERGVGLKGALLYKDVR